MKRRDIGAGFTLSQIATWTSGKLLGDPKTTISSLDSLEDGCRVQGALAFMRTNNPGIAKRLLDRTEANAVLVVPEIEELCIERKINAIVVADPLASFVSIVSKFYEEDLRPIEISDKSVIHPSVKFGKNVSVGPFCAISEDVVIGDDVIIHPNVVIYPRVKIANGCVVHSGAILREDISLGPKTAIHCNSVIGADGFGYIPDPKVGIIKVPQVGGVEIGSNVEVGAGTCVDRGTFTTTRIGSGSKLDNLVQVGHNVQIGKHCIICAHVGIAGSCTLADGVVIGGHSGVADHLTISSGVRVGAKSGVIGNLKEPGDYIGFPAIPAALWRRGSVVLRRLAKKAKEPNPE